MIAYNMSMSAPPPSRKAYPIDVSDDEWTLVAPYLTLVSKEAQQPSIHCLSITKLSRLLAKLHIVPEAWGRDGCWSYKAENNHGHP